ncbi:tetratricopeptide repeat protein [Salinibacterium sp. ZJ450]|uniref:tetratricopeptide repeat protein n=2 Tax=unclassified Salinibacterium TaxID=2632331 RepID=UPI00351D3ACD
MKRIGVAIMAALLVLYLLFTVQYAVILILDGQPVTLALGIALFVLPLVGFWALVAEVLFMLRAQKLAKTLEAEGGMPDEELPLLPSGRVDQTAADGVFPRYQGEVEAAPDSWRAWFRLGIAYEASGDRKRARWATRKAIELARR